MLDLTAPDAGRAAVPAGVDVRPGTEDDLADIVPLAPVIGQHQVASPVFARVGADFFDQLEESHREELADPEAHYLVARVDGAAVGFAIWYDGIDGPFMASSYAELSVGRRVRAGPRSRGRAGADRCRHRRRARAGRRAGWQPTGAPRTCCRRGSGRPAGSGSSAGGCRAASTTRSSSGLALRKVGAVGRRLVRGRPEVGDLGEQPVAHPDEHQGRDLLVADGDVEPGGAAGVVAVGLDEPQVPAVRVLLVPAQVGVAAAHDLAGLRQPVDDVRLSAPRSPRPVAGLEPLDVRPDQRDGGVRLHAGDARSDLRQRRCRAGGPRWPRRRPGAARRRTRRRRPGRGWPARPPLRGRPRRAAAARRGPG